MAKRKITQKKLYRLAASVKMVVFDFDGVFTDNRVWVFEDGREATCCFRSDGLGIERLKTVPHLKLLVLSKEENPVVAVRCRKLKIECIQRCDNKLSVLKKEATRRGIEMVDVCYVGNDINDVECLQAVGLSVCVGDAYPEAKLVSKLVLKKNGGRGAVRELCDRLLAANSRKEK